MLFKNYNKIVNNGQTPEIKNARKDILEIFSYALDAVDPYNAVISKFNGNYISFKSKKFDVSKYENIYLIGFGKASIRMAQAVCDSVEISEGLVITNEKNKKVDSKKVITILGDHPIPSKRNIEGTDKLLDLLKKINENDLLMVLISGGGSALLCKPRISIFDMKKITDYLLKSGANINEINTIRKHLSFVKGGQLVDFCKGKILSFIISDIVNDPIEFIASGPTYPDSTTFLDAKNIFKKYKLWKIIPNSARDIIEKGVLKKIPETLKIGNPVFKRVNNFIVANNEIACNAAIKKAEALNYKTMLLTTSLEGEAEVMGKFLVEKTINYSSFSEKLLFVSGGETTVTLSGSGKGGRNQEMVLGSVISFSNNKLIFSSFATDGIDGNSDAAGAIADGFTYLRAKKNKLNYNKFLNQNDSYNFFKKLDDLLITGSTGTNVMDIQIIIKLTN